MRLTCLAEGEVPQSTESQASLHPVKPTCETEHPESLRVKNVRCLRNRRLYSDSCSWCWCRGYKLEQVLQLEHAPPGTVRGVKLEAPAVHTALAESRQPERASRSQDRVPPV